MTDVAYDEGDGCAEDFCTSMSLLDDDDGCPLPPPDSVDYVYTVQPACVPGPRARPLYGCPAIPLLAPVDQLLRSATLVFVFTAWLFDSDIMLFLAFATLCVNLCICCGKPAVGCWMADVLTASVLLLVLLIRDTGYVVHLVFHGHANATHVHAD